jgi:hypothetical protein
MAARLDHRGLEQEVIGVEIKQPIALRLGSPVEGMGDARSGRLCQ